MPSTWKKMAAYLGLVEEYDDEYVDAADEPPPPPPRQRPAPPPEPARSEPSNVRRIAPARSESSSAPAGSPPPSSSVRPVPSAKVHVTDPVTFNDVEEVGDRFRNGIPVIMNLQGASEGVAKRVLDFASGLIYGLDGRIERVGDRVFLLTPMGIEVSSEERRRLSERGFFNQA